MAGEVRDEELGEEDKLTSQIYDVGGTTISNMRFPNSKPSSVWEQVPTSDIIEDDMSSSVGEATSELDIPFKHQGRFDKIRQSIEAKQYNCGGMRKIFRRFVTAGQAQLAHLILMSEHHHLIDPLMVRNNEIFRLSVDSFEGLCSNEARNNNLKLFRAPLKFVPSFALQGHGDADVQAQLPVNPYFLGLWLGDGFAASQTVCSADPETRVWLESLVASLNASRPHITAPLELKSYRMHAAGDIITNRYISNLNVFCYGINSTFRKDGRGY